MPLLLIALSFLSAVLLGCDPDSHTRSSSSAPTKFTEERPMRIVTTTGPVGDLLRNIAGEVAEVHVMMGPGVDPHLYRELPSDIRRLAKADIVFYNGLHLEGRMGETLERLARTKPVFAVTGRLIDSSDKRLLTPPDFAGHPDPHVWHDVALWSDCLDYVVEVLSGFDPECQEEYERAGEVYRDQLKALDAECQAELGALPEGRRVMVTAHDAFEYFGRAYGLETIGLKGISTEDEVDLNRMDNVVRLIVQRKLPCVFVESAVAPRIIEALVEPCRELGHELTIPKTELYADALGSPESGADSYVGMIRANVRTIVDGLGEK